MSRLNTELEVRSLYAFDLTREVADRREAVIDLYSQYLDQVEERRTVLFDLLETSKSTGDIFTTLPYLLRSAGVHEDRVTIARHAVTEARAETPEGGVPSMVIVGNADERQIRYDGDSDELSFVNDMARGDINIVVPKSELAEFPSQRIIPMTSKMLLVGNPQADGMEAHIQMSDAVLVVGRVGVLAARRSL